MSENQHAAAEGNAAPAKKEKLGCFGCLGLLLMLAAILAVVFFLVLKPKLEEQGVDVDSSLETVQQSVKTGMEKAGEYGRKGVDAVVETAGRAAEKSSEAVEKAVDNAEKIEDAAEKSADWVEESAQNAQETVESWY